MKKILLIEDNETIIKGLKYTLEQEGYNVETAESIIKAKTKIKKEQYAMKIINLKSESIEYGYNILSKYGIDGKDSSVIKGLDNSKREIIIINTITIIVFLALITIVFINYKKSREKELEKILKYIQQINEKNYELKIEENSEDELSNLVKNCIEHSPEKSRIYIDFYQNKFYTGITIKDEGKGIDKKDIKHIFERFYKGKNSTESSVGIGLAISKNIIEKDGGNIKCSSEKNNGAIFEIKYLFS